MWHSSYKLQFTHASDDLSHRVQLASIENLVVILSLLGLLRVVNEGQYDAVQVNMVLAIAAWSVEAEAEISVGVLVGEVRTQELHANTLHMQQ